MRRRTITNLLISCLIVLLVLHSVFPQPVSNNGTESKSIPISEGGEAPQNIISISNNYIISIVGQDYFGQYFQYLGSSKSQISSATPNTRSTDSTTIGHTIPPQNTQEQYVFTMSYRYFIPYWKKGMGVDQRVVSVSVSSDGNVISYRAPPNHTNSWWTRVRQLKLQRNQVCKIPATQKLYMEAKALYQI